MITIRTTKVSTTKILTLLAIVIAFAIVASLACFVGEPMLASKIGGMMADRVVRILIWADRLPLWLLAVLGGAGIAAGTIYTMIKRLGIRYATNW